jgi:integrase
MTQLTGRSIKQEDGIWIIDINPRDGDVKTHVFRKVPIHEHLIEQGFLEFVRSRGSGPLFYKIETGRRGSDANPPYVRMGQKLAEWVRTIGVEDRNVDPNHGWRHLFKTTARRVEMREDHMDAICGHAAASVGRKYGEFPIETLAAAIALLPRFVVEPAATVDGRRK